MIAFLRILLFRDFWLKLFSLALAVLIWLTVAFAQRGGGQKFFASHAVPEETLFDIPVLVMSAAADVRSFKVNPGQVQVTVRGDAKVLQDLQARDIRALVDLTGIEAARNLHKQIEVTTPRGITFVQAIPDGVDVIVPSKR